MMAWVAPLIALQVKHVLFDFCCQTGWILEGKARYGAAGGVLHAGLHGAGSFLVLLFVAALPVALVLSLLEAVAHYHIDWLKARVGDKADTGSPRYWCLFGLDQLLHQLTMITVLAIALTL
ncbi:DUF3307 domain-containing protein [Donghicola tyrosinivorans]|uniref:Uncharacterized protein DUF3307 n=1 Tax=Donghicola tyrosinivorans TaxID=1652492 RepID=A0A2T0WEE5_9RHOB|nr:DUF3307 domain-containing protein [Donghicola tyrosinivorans]PRY85077.1 uncharacterized protein DUF3307 [Donghicola tyrosinivorans]